MKLNKTISLSTIAILLLTAGVSFALWNNEAKQNGNLAPGEEKFDADYQDGDYREQHQSVGSGTTINDLGDSEIDSAAPDNPIVSTSGEITVYSPGENEYLASGDMIKGKTKTDNIHYRIIDYDRGVMAQGELTVQNGNFLGEIRNLFPVSERGRLDVFSINAATGSEENPIEIAVRFKQ